MRLKSDIHGIYKPETIYGRKGDKVKIIRDCGNVILVEGADGNKFPVPVDQLTEDILNKNDN